MSPFFCLDFVGFWSYYGLTIIFKPSFELGEYILMAEKLSTIKRIDVTAPLGFVFTTFIQGGRRDSDATFTQYRLEQTLVFEDVKIDFDIEIRLNLAIFPRADLDVESRVVYASAIYLQTIENGGMHVYLQGEEPDQFLLNKDDSALMIQVIE